MVAWSVTMMDGSGATRSPPSQGRRTAITMCGSAHTPPMRASRLRLSTFRSFPRLTARRNPAAAANREFGPAYGSASPQRPRTLCGGRWGDSACHAAVNLQSDFSASFAVPQPGLAGDLAYARLREVADALGEYSLKTVP